MQRWPSAASEDRNFGWSSSTAPKRRSRAGRPRPARIATILRRLESYKDRWQRWASAAREDRNQKKARTNLCALAALGVRGQGGSQPEEGPHEPVRACSAGRPRPGRIATSAPPRVRSATPQRWPSAGQGGSQQGLACDALASQLSANSSWPTGIRKALFAAAATGLAATGWRPREPRAPVTPWRTPSRVSGQGPCGYRRCRPATLRCRWRFTHSARMVSSETASVKSTSLISVAQARSIGNTASGAGFRSAGLATSDTSRHRRETQHNRRTSLAT